MRAAEIELDDDDRARLKARTLCWPSEVGIDQAHSVMSHDFLRRCRIHPQALDRGSAARACWGGPWVERDGRREPRDYEHPDYPFELDCEFIRAPQE